MGASLFSLYVYSLVTIKINCFTHTEQKIDWIEKNKFKKEIRKLWNNSITRIYQEEFIIKG